MKIIPKFQAGGDFSSLFTIYKPLAESKLLASSALAPSSKKDNDDETKGKLTEKDFFNMIKDINGLPNEMRGVINLLINTFNASKIIGEDVGNLATDYLQSLYQIKLIALNKVKYDDAIKTARENGSMAEPAISMDGKLIAQDSSGKTGTISIEQYNKNPKAYKVLSVSQLANLRAYDSRFNMDNDVFDIIHNSMGFESFLKLLKEGIASLGKTTTTRNGMSFTLTYEDATLAIQQLAMLSDEDKKKVMNGIIEGTSITENLAKQINELTLYLNLVLPDRAKTWAAVKMGMSDKNKATDILIRTYLTSQSSSSSSIKYEYKDYLSRLDSDIKDKNELSKKDDLLKMNQNTASKWMAGYGASEQFEINPGSATSIVVRANTMPLVDKSGNSLGSNSTLLDATSGKGFSGILNWRSVSMAGTIISPSLFNLILLSDGKISSIDFPSRINEQGKVVPILDKETYNKKRRADADLKNRGIDVNNPESIKLNYKIVNQIYKNYSLNPAYNENGEPTNWTRFGVINATTDGRVLGEDFNRSAVNELTGAQADNIAGILKEKTKSYSYSHGYFGLFSDSIFEGTVWIPVTGNQLAAMANDNTTAALNLRIYELEEAQRMYNKPSQLN